MGFKRKGPSLHKGTVGHKKALNRYQELNVERSPAKELKGGQHKIDKNKDGKISKTDFDMMKKSPAKMGKMDSAAKLKKDSPADLKKDSPADLKASPAKIIPGLKKKGTKGTKFVDKVKAAGKAVGKHVGEVHEHGTDNTMSHKIARTYKRLKKESREGRGQGMKKPAKPQTPPKTTKEKANVIAKMKSPAKMKGRESSTQKGLRERGIKKSKSPHVALTKSGKVEKMGLGGDKMVKRKGAPKDFKF